jgi:hypothetical protein
MHPAELTLCPAGSTLTWTVARLVGIPGPHPTMHAIWLLRNACQLPPPPPPFCSVARKCSQAFDTHCAQVSDVVLQRQSAADCMHFAQRQLVHPVCHSNKSTRHAASDTHNSCSDRMYRLDWSMESSGKTTPFLHTSTMLVTSHLFHSHTEPHPGWQQRHRCQA